LPVSSSTLGYYLTTNYSQEQIDLMVDVSNKLTVRVGYRYVWGDASDVTLPIAGLTGYEQGQLRRNAGIAGVTYKPTSKLSFNGEVEAATSSGSYFRTSLYNYQKMRVRGRYQLKPTLQFAVDANLLNNQNPTPGINYDYLAHQESASVIWSPTAAKGWDFQGSYTRSTIYSNISYLEPQTLQAQQDLYRDNSHTVTLLLDGKLPLAADRIATLSAGGSMFLSSGSRPTSFYQPIVRLSVPVTRQMAWVSEWRYYGFGETFTIYENFRTHLVTTGLRLTR
jgi:hypothetical protein